MSLFRTLLSPGCSLLLMLSANSLGAQELGMQVIGDEDNEFGLFIAQWMDAKDALLLAPAFIDEPTEFIDPWSLQMQRQARSAIRPEAEHP